MDEKLKQFIEENYTKAEPGTVIEEGTEVAYANSADVIFYTTAIINTVGGDESIFYIKKPDLSAAKVLVHKGTYDNGDARREYFVLDKEDGVWFGTNDANYDTIDDIRREYDNLSIHL